MIDADETSALRTALGRVGVWSFALEAQSSATEREAAAEIEELGYRALWFPESVPSPDTFTHASLVLGATSRVMVASGIANTWARDPLAMANGHRLLSDAHPGRFVLGLGVSHAPAVARRGGSYANPLQHMRRYLDAMDGAPTRAPLPASPPRRVLAALGPRMLELAAERALGAHSYFVPVEHTPIARKTLGPGPVLAVEQTVILETDPERARRVARGSAAYFLELVNYTNNLRRLGFEDEDLTNGGSDRLIDAAIAWGDVDSIRGRVKEHLEAGADHVCVQVVSESDEDVCLPQLRELAPALLDL